MCQVPAGTAVDIGELSGAVTGSAMLSLLRCRTSWSKCERIKQSQKSKGKVSSFEYQKNNNKGYSCSQKC